MIEKDGEIKPGRTPEPEHVKAGRDDANRHDPDRFEHDTVKQAADAASSRLKDARRK
jgi:hypothetical protein